MEEDESEVMTHFLGEQAWYASLKARLSAVYFTVIKLPLILFAIVFGFILEFMVELPFIALLLLDYRSDIGKNHR